MFICEARFPSPASLSPETAKSLPVGPFLPIATSMAPSSANSGLGDSLAQEVPGRGLWLLGCGTMGGALLARWLAGGLPSESVTVIDPAPANLPRKFAGRRVGSLAEAFAQDARPSVFVFGVKPQTLPKVAPALADLGGERTLLVSMMAGVRTATIAELVPGAPIARIMPNTPARIGKGVIAVHGVELEPHERQFVDRLMRTAGSVLWLDDEAKFDAVTALSGSGPAFLFRFIEAFAGAGEAVGLDPDTAAQLALQTVIGAAALAEQSDVAPSVLRRQVTSKGGVTEAGLDILDGKGELSRLLRATLRGAAEKSRKLALAADSILTEE